ncbi:ATP-binding protein [Streptomyces crystallinus]|uniref:histidine kinase n=1 Tax=Streptomyces crystallinus TaxID=68191 RepID=A0ABP3RQD5_9ACTN
MTEPLWWSSVLISTGAAALAFGERRRCRRLQEQVRELEAERNARDFVLYSVAAFPWVDWLRAAQQSMATPEFVQVPPRLHGSKTAGYVQRLGQNLAHSTHVLCEEARARAAREIEERAAGDTRAAVRAIATQVAGQGTEAGRAVSAMLGTQSDDDAVEELLELDHLLQQLVRTAQSYVVLCGGTPPGRSWPATSFTDVVRGAMGRIRSYRRVQFQELELQVAGRAVEPLVQIVAALLDNATQFSPPNAWVQVNFQQGHQGVTVIIDDAGLRMNEEQLAAAHAVLTGQRQIDIHALGPVPQTGFPMIAEHLRRYGFAVRLEVPSAFEGTRAMVFVPSVYLVSPAEQGGSAPEATASPVQPGVTQGGLPTRSRRSLDPSATPSLPPHRPTHPAPAGAAGAAAAWSKGTRSGRAAAHEINSQQEEVGS